MLRLTLGVAVAIVGAILGATPAAHAGDSLLVAQGQQRGQQPMRQGQGMRGGGPGGGGGMTQSRRMLQMMDQDGDGRLSAREFVETPRPGAGADSEMAQRNRAARFDQLDANGDGQLDADELADMPNMLAQ